MTLRHILLGIMFKIIDITPNNDIKHKQIDLMEKLID